MKKILLPLAIFFSLLWTWSSTFAQATNYDFSASGGGVTVTGNLSGSGSLITGISNVVYNGVSVTSGSIFYPIPNTYYGTVTPYDGTSYTPSTAVSFVVLQGGYYNNVGIAQYPTNGAGQVYQALTLSDASSYVNLTNTTYFTSVSITSTGAPEIDGSLTPKVGFLLCCLFLIFGRKRYSSEPFLGLEAQ